MLFTILGMAVVVTMYVMNLIQSENDKFERYKQTQEIGKNRTVKVVYATKNIAEGEYIAQEALEERDIPVGNAPVDCLNSVNTAVGSQAAYPILAGTVLSHHAMRTAFQTQNFDGRIKDGMRAITFGVDSNSGVAGFIMPGSHVDVVAIVGSAEATKAAPVLSDVSVIAVGTTYQKAPGSTVANPAGSVTVAVTPQDGLKLIRSVSAAKLYLSLRGAHDFSPVAVVDVNNLYGTKSPSTDKVAMTIPDPGVLPPLPPVGLGDKLDVPNVQAPPPPPAREIEMWSGTKKEVLSVPQG
jgi:pilus assembly protein CpaB